MGFWVAMTRNGAVTGWVTPSIVTWPSSMTSSSADCVFGLARLISSASTMVANTGPRWNSNSPERWSYTVMPVMSPGSRSGVNCTRVVVPRMLCASARAIEVFPVPGTSSSRRWPSLSRAVRLSRITYDLPSTTCSTFATMRSAMSANQEACSGVMVMVGTPGCR